MKKELLPVDNTTHQFLIGLVAHENEGALKRYMKAAAKHATYKKISQQYKDTEVLHKVSRAYAKEQQALAYLKQVEAAYKLVIKLCE